MLELNEYEKIKRDETLATAGYDPMKDFEETVEGSASYHYAVYPSNIGDFTYLVYKGVKTLLSDLDSF